MNKSWINLAAFALIVTATCAHADDPSGFWNYAAPAQASACEPDVSAATNVRLKFWKPSLEQYYSRAAGARQVSLHECGCMYSNYTFTQFLKDAIGKNPDAVNFADLKVLDAATTHFAQQQVPWLQMQKTTCKGKS